MTRLIGRLASLAMAILFAGCASTAEVNLFDVRTNKLVWGGTTETFNPSSVQRESAGFADVVISALAKQGLVPSR
jgi:hypothetical protein